MKIILYVFIYIVYIIANIKENDLIYYKNNIVSLIVLHIVNYDECYLDKITSTEIITLCILLIPT